MKRYNKKLDKQEIENGVNLFFKQILDFEDSTKQIE